MENDKNWSLGSILKYLLFLLFIVGLLVTPELIQIKSKDVFHNAALICFLILFLYFLLVDYWGRKKDIKKTVEKDEKSKNRTFITIWMATVGLGIIVIFGILVYNSVGTAKADASKWVFNATIPLIASWIGTVLAFYFGRENFESATDRILQFSREALDDIFVERIMISKKTMLNLIYKDEKTLDLAEDELASIDDILKFYKSNGKDRVPILDENSRPLFIVHLASLEQVVDKTISFKDFLELEKHKSLYGHNKPQGFIITQPKNTLDDATKRMLLLKDCKDIFITEDGSANSEVQGWITDSLATRFLSSKSNLS